MTKVIPLHSPRAAAPIGIERQQAIENALSTALYYVRHPAYPRPAASRHGPRTPRPEPVKACMRHHFDDGGLNHENPIQPPDRTRRIHRLPAYRRPRNGRIRLQCFQ
jgi:hypothetical protein